MISEDGHGIERLDAGKAFSGGSRRRVIGCTGEILPLVESTMDLCRQRVESGAPDGYVLVAEEQRAGRGRKGKWECPCGLGLLMSVLLRLGLPRSKRKLIGIMGALATAEAVQRVGPPARIKWPNDIVITARPSSPRAECSQELALKKLGGVLVEQVPRSDAAPIHILGIGVNVNQPPELLPAHADLPPTSVRIERGGAWTDRSTLCRMLIERLDFWYEKLARGQFERLLARWRTLSCLLGQRVTIAVGSDTFVGEVLGLRATGELVVKNSAGQSMPLTDEKTTLVFAPRDKP